MFPPDFRVGKITEDLIVLEGPARGVEDEVLPPPDGDVDRCLRFVGRDLPFLKNGTGVCVSAIASSSSSKMSRREIVVV
jgi:hypothetical protein